jgi:hypothetical protein
MRKHRLFVGRIVVMLALLALLALPVSAASAHATTPTRPDPADGTTFLILEAREPASSSAEYDVPGSSTIWLLEALAGMSAVLGLGEALRRRHRRSFAHDWETVPF